ncbi:Zn(II)2Cys6 transcription factor domain-containing protein [Aspergillus ibericus CBS 121593]|uniref:Zn(2)-C6 fungal-type domain-containing protein n=1 Tax=Aspergillus ibericus CBS 121593 TaxID=1448316 RepID=A0A395HEJ0_9EURO|nr:hypothetical protein BO80DRAFT_440991 [Aspergillus ibericus CBS 121593]RAL05408.1 hypothetical protein BO80DRAFT_440991 [Aspergillus ibericus CBS 121593]
MFGAFRCTSGAQNNSEYIDMSTKAGMETRKSSVIACDQCKAQKIKCNGDLYGCERCQEKSANCTYRTPTRTPTPAGPSRSKRPSPDTSAPASKRQRAESVSDALSSPVDPHIKVQTPMTRSSPVFVNSYQEWDEFCDANVTDHQGLNLSLEESVPCLPMMSSGSEFHSTPPSLASPSTSYTSHGGRNFYLMTPPTATIGQGSYDYRRRRCTCVQSLANTLEEVAGDNTRSRTDNSDRSDYLLMSMHHGVGACNRVLACTDCTVCTSNSILLVTVAQQLATRSMDLCDLLLALQDKPKPVIPDELPDLKIGGVFVGRYQVQIAAVCRELVHTVAEIHFRDLRQLLECLSDRIVKKSKAARMLADATEEAKKAYCILEGIMIKRAAEKSKRDSNAA